MLKSGISTYDAVLHIVCIWVDKKISCVVLTLDPVSPAAPTAFGSRGLAMEKPASCLVDSA